MTDDTAWPARLDGIIAAPNHHRVLFENSEVRVIETVVPAGDSTPIHTHPKTVMYILSGSHFVRKDGAGNVMVDTREEGPDFVLPPVLWSDGAPPHVIENPTADDLKVIGVELKT